MRMNHEMPFFTIVIPTYNRADLIDVAINSVLNQTFQDFEIIVVDDCSKDNTETVVGNYTDQRIAYIRNEKNLERSLTRNKGIDNAKGKYILFLDSDDYYLNTHLQVFYNKIEENKFEDAMYFCSKIFSENGKLTPSIMNPLTDNPVEYFFCNIVYPCQVCISANILKENKFRNDVIIMEDMVLWMQIANKYPVFLLPEPTCVYLMHDTNSVNTSKFNAFQQRLNGMHNLMKTKELVAKVPLKTRRQALSDCYFGIYRYFKAKNNKWKMLKAVLQSIVFYPDIKFKIKLYMLLCNLPVFSVFFKE